MNPESEREVGWTKFGALPATTNLMARLWIDDETAIR